MKWNKCIKWMHMLLTRSRKLNVREYCHCYFCVSELHNTSRVNPGDLMNWTGQIRKWRHKSKVWTKVFLSFFFFFFLTRPGWKRKQLNQSTFKDVLRKAVWNFKNKDITIAETRFGTDYFAVLTTHKPEAFVIKVSGVPLRFNLISDELSVGYCLGLLKVKRSSWNFASKWY